ncbi:putative outer membrane protein [Escherichia coli]|nr:putative outer membrane protein [Escherichia coli]
MKKRVYLIAAVVSGALAVSGCTTNPYTGEREAGKSAIGAGLGSLVGAGIGALSSSKKDRGKGALHWRSSRRSSGRRRWLLHGCAGSEAA